MSNFEESKFQYALMSTMAEYSVDIYLRKFKIHPDQVRQQPSGELKESLRQVNKALTELEVLNKRIKSDTDPKAIDIRAMTSPLFKSSLLSAKKIILDRLESTSSVQKIESIQDLISQVTDKKIQSKLHDEINGLRDDSEKLRALSQEVEEDKEKLDLKTRMSLERLSTETFERRSKVWFSLLERESSATILGGVLLLIITAAHVSAIFSKIEVPQIWNNILFIVLGYFFGQSKKDKSKEKD